MNCFGMFALFNGRRATDHFNCSDYRGAVNAGFNALLLRRPGLEGEHEHKEENENLESVEVIHGLKEAIHCVQERK